MRKSNCFFIASLCFLSAAPLFAQEGKPGPEAASARLSPVAASLADHLQLQGSQIERLDRLYSRYSPLRAKQEATLAQQQSDLQLAQAPTTFDERKSDRLLRDIEQTRQKMTADALATRAGALKILTPVQRSQLEALTHDPRFAMRDDSIYQLLAAPVDGPWGPSGTARAAANGRPYERHQEPSRTNGRYDVYGGYGYGRPQYGVYGSVGQGPIGVYGGVGRGGPSIGIGIGGIFGLGRYLR